jgi:hypothetical protein
MRTTFALVSSALLVYFLLVTSTHASCAQRKAQDVEDEVIQRLKETYDSLDVLGNRFPGSQLIIGYRDSPTYDTVMMIDGLGVERIDTFNFNYADVLTNTGNVLVSVRRADIEYFESADRKRVCLRLWDADCSRSPFGRGCYLLIDVHDPSIRDSGQCVEITRTDFLYLERDGLKNVFEIGSGCIFQWDDPFVNSIKAVWNYRGNLIFVVRNEDERFQLFSRDKRLVSDHSFNGFADRILDYDTTRFGDVKYGDDWNWIQVDLETGDIEAKQELQCNRITWWFCNDSRKCINRVQFTSVENRHSRRHANRALVMLEFRERGTEEVLYRKKHWVDMNIGPGEVSGSQPIYLDTEVWFSRELTWNAEVLEFR